MQLARKAASAAAASAASSNSSSGIRLVYSTNPTWPYPPAGSSSSNTNSNVGDSGVRWPASSRTIDIAVLDSSFNPPTSAHFGLLLSRPILAQPAKDAYDGHLLLFSTQNADKGSGKPGDASLAQRVEMMTLMARDVERSHRTGSPANVAVGLVDKPLIFAKSTLTWEYLKQQKRHEDVQVRLHWVVGFDTLYRVFQLKYYPSLQEFQRQCKRVFEQEGTTLVCARRDASSYPQLDGMSARAESAEEQAKQEEEDKLLASEHVGPWVERGSIGMLNLSVEEAKISSTQIRALVKDDSVCAEDKRQRLVGLVPPGLVDYLIVSGIYRDDV